MDRTDELIEKLNLQDEEVLNEATRQAMRAACKANLFYLTKYILGYSDLNERIHKPLCEVIEAVNPFITKMSEGKRPEVKFNWKNEDKCHANIRPFIQFNEDATTRLFLMFRGSFKSTVITIAHTIQLLLIWPDIRILIASHKKEDGSEPLVGSIRHHFMRNKKLRWLFPEYCPQPNKMGQIEWGARDSILLPNRSEGAAWPEMSVETAGMTTDVTGRHYDYIKKDDLVTKDSVSNETMIQKTRYFDSLTRFLFVQPEWGIADYVGTPYHFNDIYANLRKSSVTKVAIPIYDEQGFLTFPERFTDKGVEAIRNSPDMDSFSFSAQYMLNPVPSDEQDFRPEYFEGLDFYYHEAPTNLRKYMFVDPANKRSRKSDFTAVCVIGIDENDIIYLLDIVRDKFGVEERTNLVLDKAQEHGLKKVHYEAIGFQDTDCYIIKKKCTERKIWVDIEEVKHGNASKEDRIRSLVPTYQRRRIRWPRKLTYFSKYERKSVDMLELLKDEMLMFPKCEHDDMIDCHAMLTKATTYKAEKQKEATKEDEFMRARQLAIDAKKPKQDFRGFGRKVVFRGIKSIQGWGR